VPKPLVRAVFRNFGKYLLEFFTMTKRLGPAFIESHVKINNIEFLHEVLEKGKGGVIVSAHIGNWEMGGAVLSMSGIPLSVVALSHKDPRVNALFNRQREVFGAMVVQTDVAVRRVIEHLRKNRLVAILADRDFGNRGIVMDFWGLPTMIPKGAAFFSLKTGAPIVPIFFNRTGEHNFEINIHPPIEPPHLQDGKITDQTAAEYIRKYLTIIEDEIKKSPSQWLLFREFWQP
jgi:KDO2-lipid IV(A) lauroyltransferase